MSKEQEDLRNKFEEETAFKCWTEPYFNDVGFSDKYVEWLEKQLLIPRVSNNVACEVVVCPNCKDTLVKQVASTNKNCVSCGTTVKAN